MYVSIIESMCVRVRVPHETAPQDAWRSVRQGARNAAAGRTAFVCLFLYKLAFEMIIDLGLRVFVAFSTFFFFFVFVSAVDAQLSKFVSLFDRSLYARLVPSVNRPRLPIICRRNFVGRDRPSLSETLHVTNNTNDTTRHDHSCSH
jgi:hypothetical protein